MKIKTVLYYSWYWQEKKVCSFFKAAVGEGKFVLLEVQILDHYHSPTIKVYG